MKKYVWSEVEVDGGKPFTGTAGRIRRQTTGAFQNLPIEDVGDMLGGSFKAPEYYADSAVIAFKVAETDVPLEALHPKITTEQRQH